MAISNVIEQKRTRIATILSTKPLLMGMSAVDIGWFFHLLAAMWMGYYAFHGENPLAFTGLHAPAYKIGVVAIAEGARAILSMANVWEEEINWLASTVLVMVLLTMGGADIERLHHQAAQVQADPDPRQRRGPRGHVRLGHPDRRRARQRAARPARQGPFLRPWRQGSDQRL